jgi:YVTN family beta-propeller protein
MSKAQQNNRLKRAGNLLVGAILSSAALGSAGAAVPSRSTNIAITADDTRLINLNHDTGTATVFKINAGQTGSGALAKLAEISVGDEPTCVAINPSKEEAYVVTADGFVSVIALDGASIYTVVSKIPVKTEPRGCALTPSGNILYVANYTNGTVQAITTANRQVAATSKAEFGRPYAIAVSNNGDANDFDERVFVTDFLASAIPALAGGKGRPFDTGNQGFVRSFLVGQLANVTPTTLAPLADAGFTADRTAFCQAGAHSQVYCPSPQPADLTKVPQGAFPNQLYSALIRGNKLFLPNIGAAPEPPVIFNNNVQALVHVVNTNTLTQFPADSFNNLNAQIKTENGGVSTGIPVGSLQRLFGNDIVAIDANPAGTQFLVVSRGGNYVLKAGLKSGKLDIGAPNVSRFRTGHIPTGVVISSDGTRAYTNNEVGRSVSVLDLAANKTLVVDVPSTNLPAVGSFEHNRLIGKLVFFTALGVDDNKLTTQSIRKIIPANFRGKQSSDGWSSCASCHPDGLADGVTWIFADGPRQTIPLDGTYSKLNAAHDARILNWSAVRGSNTDFNNNSRGVQGGIGFAGNPPNPNIYNHGITQGASEALDLETLWLQSIRPLAQPQPTVTTDLTAGRSIFQDNCASCHGGAKWTKSQILYRDNPALVRSSPTDPTAGVPSDPGVSLAPSGGSQILSFKANNKTLTYLEPVGTFSAANPLEIKANGQGAFGTDGFNVPSLLGVRSSAPYFHDGSAEKITDVFRLHTLPGGKTINSALSATQRTQLSVFLNALDGKTTTVRSAADDFRDPF